MEEVKEFNLIIDGEEKNVELLTVIKIEELDLEFGYCYIKEENDTDSTQKELYTFKVEKDEEGKDLIVPIEDEEERQLAFEIFSDYYKKTQAEEGEK